MNTILIISPDQSHFNMFNAHYGHMPVHFSWARNLDEAVKYIELENPAHIFLISASQTELMNWIETIKAGSGRAPFICFTKRLDWADREMLWNSGCLDIFNFPLNRKELEYILRTLTINSAGISKEKNEHIRGTLSDFNVIDLIITFEKCGNSGILFLENGSKKGQIKFTNGRVYNAEYLDCDPLEAVTIMADWNSGIFYAKFDQKERSRQIMLENAQIIMECENFQKKKKSYLKKLPAPDQKIFSDTELNFEEFGPKDREWLLKFSTGYSIGQLLDEYDGNLSFVLKKFLSWMEHGWLMNEETYKLHQARILAENRKSVFKKVMGKVFSSSKKHEQEIKGPKVEVQEKEGLLDRDTVKPYLFNDLDLVQEFKQTLEETA